MLETLRSIKERFSEAVEAGREAYNQALRPTSDETVVSWVRKNSPPYTKNYWLPIQLEGILLETARAERNECAKLMCPLCAAGVDGSFDHKNRSYLHKKGKKKMKCKAGAINYRRVHDSIPADRRVQ
jgi:hypothetical protein